MRGGEIRSLEFKKTENATQDKIIEYIHVIQTYGNDTTPSWVGSK